MSDCIFCKIVNGDIPSTRVFENEKVIAFKDLKPQAKLHYLFIHKGHSRDLNDMVARDLSQVQDIFCAIKEFSESEGLTQKGYRIVNNIGPDAGQTVFHTHFHLLAGEPLGHFGA